MTPCLSLPPCPFVTNSAQQSTANLAKKILQDELPSPFSLRDVYRKQWAFLDDKEVVQKACDELVELGWLRQEIPMHEKGRPRLPMYVVNPKTKIFSQNA